MTNSCPCSCSIQVSGTADPSFGGQGRLFQSKLLANRPRESVFDLRVPWDRHRPAVGRICIKIVVSSVTLQITAAFSETSYELSPLHSEIAISCLSFGTNVLSAASSTISR